MMKMNDIVVGTSSLGAPKWVRINGVEVAVTEMRVNFERGFTTVDLTLPVNSIKTVNCDQPEPGGVLEQVKGALHLNESDRKGP